MSHVTGRLEVDEYLQKAMRGGAYELGTEPEEIRNVLEVELRDEILRRLRQAP